MKKLQELVTLEGPGGRDVLMFVMSVMVSHIYGYQAPFRDERSRDGVHSETRDSDIIFDRPVYSLGERKAGLQNRHPCSIGL